MNKKKIVHITTVHPPFDTRIFYKECASLAQEGYEVYLIFTESNDFSGSKFDEYNIIPIKINKYNNRFKRVFKGTRDALTEALKIKADIYHIHDPELLIITNRLKEVGARVVYDIHEDYYTSIKQKDYIPNIIRKILANLFRNYENYKVKGLYTVLAEKYYRDNFIKGRCVLNYPIINPKNNRISFGNTNKLLYTGNVTVDRGAYIHSSIPNYVEDISVQLVGKCSSDLATRIKNEKVYIDGIDNFVVREDIDRYYNEEKWLAGLAIFPPSEHYMKKELTKFFEYMYAGLPIIASDFPEWKNFINKYQCGITVNYDSQEDIVDAINYLRNNPKEAKKMGENGQRAVVEELNWKKEANKLMDFYEEILIR